MNNEAYVLFGIPEQCKIVYENDALYLHSTFPSNEFYQQIIKMVLMAPNSTDIEITLDDGMVHYLRTDNAYLFIMHLVIRKLPLHLKYEDGSVVVVPSEVVMRVLE